MTVDVHVPTPLRSYTGKVNVVQAEGDTLAAVFEDLDRRYPGLRFRLIDEQDRVREHIKLFVNRSPVADLGYALHAGDAVHIITAISGG